jgi:hypothetical chaperone protein
MCPAQKSVSLNPAIGIDFGTTNSSVALASSNAVELVRFPRRGGETESFRSVLYMERVRQAGHMRIGSWTGPAAIEHYLDAEKKGRLIQSLKSYLSSSNLTGTEILGRHFSFEDLIARILTDLRLNAERQFGFAIKTATVGRPVRFVGADSDQDDAFAVERLRRAFTSAGFETIDLLMEPEAAAYAYEATLDHDELILIGDFGGGTSDFSLLKVGPGIRKRGRKPEDLLGNSGLGLAGDAFDARIVRKLVSPELGAGTLLHPASKMLPAVPAWIYSNLERWHYLSFLRTRNVTEILKSARARAIEPDKIEALITLVDEDLGFQLHQAVQRLKFELSSAQTAEFRFIDGTLELRKLVQRADFESWIADDLAALECCIDGLFAKTAVAYADVDRVFLTGGTSFVPAVRSIFERRFGKDRVRSGNEFTSVARGLALRAAEAQDKR